MRLEGLDGALARTQGAQSDFGGYADIVLDFVVYAVIPIAFVVATPTAANGLAALVLLASFYVNAASWMYLAAILERRGAGAEARGELTAVTMPEGLVGGTETILLYDILPVAGAGGAALQPHGGAGCGDRVPANRVGGASPVKCSSRRSPQMRSRHEAE